MSLIWLLKNEGGLYEIREVSCTLDYHRCNILLIFFCWYWSFKLFGFL